MDNPDSAVTRSSSLLLPIALTVFLLSGCNSSSTTATAVVEPDVTQTDADTETEDNLAPETNTEAEQNPASDDSVTLNNGPAHTGTNIPANHVLAALPNPPRTPAPRADSEPVRAELRTGTITEFFMLRDPVQDLSDTAVDELSEADFLAGPLPAVISVPPDVDPLENSPPYFVGLKNVEVFAGEELVVLYDPDDPDGGNPGLLAGILPPGAQFSDNFDTTKSLRWRPLQPDVGIHEFTAFAIDPVAPFYRSAETIRIKVKLPADQSNIINLPPAINRIQPHTVRVNDPVVAYIKVTDPNGTIPILKILNLPAGSTITPHPQEEDISILHFTPDTPGEITLKLQAIDSADSSLTGSQDVSIEVLPEADFIRPGARLRDLASERGLLYGYAALQSFYERPDGALYADIAGDEFNIVSTENSIKFDFINPLPGKFRWAATDNLIKQAKIDQQIIHGHTLVWHRQLPSWVRRTEPANREWVMREFIDRVLARYADDIPLWDVVNESLEEDGSFRNSVWFESMGASYIDIAFRQARQSAPDATLIYNDYGIAVAGPKTDSMLSLLQQLKDAGTPVQGVGFQLHLFANFDQVDEVIATFQKVADMDLDIYVTEFDVSMADGHTLAQQAAVYEQILSVCLAQPRCKAFQTWGYTDQYSWREDLNPLLFDKRYQVKPAYLSVQQRLSEN